MTANIKFTNRGDKTCEILLYDEIGASPWGGGMSAKDFIQRLNDEGDLSSIDLRINSPGGQIFDGAAIYNALVAHPAAVNVYIDGLAASCASWIAMAGDKRYMAQNAMMMIHQAQVFTIGDAEDHRSQAELLDKLDNTIAKSYADRTGRKVDTWAKKMDDETWFTAEEALEEKLVDEIIPGKKMVAAFDRSILNRFKHQPEKLVALFVEPEAEEAPPPVETPANEIDLRYSPEAVAVRLRALELAE